MNAFVKSALFSPSPSSQQLLAFSVGCNLCRDSSCFFNATTPAIMRKLISFQFWPLFPFSFTPHLLGIFSLAPHFLTFSSVCDLAIGISRLFFAPQDSAAAAAAAVAAWFLSGRSVDHPAGEFTLRASCNSQSSLSPISSHFSLEFAHSLLLAVAKPPELRNGPWL